MNDKKEMPFKLTARGFMKLVFFVVTILMAAFAVASKNLHWYTSLPARKSTWENSSAVNFLVTVPKNVVRFGSTPLVGERK